MGMPNASIPTPEPVKQRKMFGAYGKSPANNSILFISKVHVLLHLQPLRPSTFKIFDASFDIQSCQECAQFRSVQECVPFRSCSIPFRSALRSVQELLHSVQECAQFRSVKECTPFSSAPLRNQRSSGSLFLFKIFLHENIE